MEYAILRGIMIALALGFVIGVQRRTTSLFEERKIYAGGRTFALISLLGYLASWVNEYIPGTMQLILISVVLLILMAYRFKVLNLERMGITSEVVMVITYLLGVFVYYEMESYALFVTVIILVVLEFKDRLRKIESYITPQETESTVFFLAITFVVLPILPDRAIDPYGVFNPYQVWLMVVLIAGISFVGYIAIRVLGNKRGAYLTGIFGGLLASTAVSITFSKKSRDDALHMRNFAGGIAVASTVMYLRVFVELMIFNRELAITLSAAYLAAAFSGFAYAYYLYRTTSAKIGSETESVKNPLGMSEALKLGLLFGLIFGSIAFFQERFGDVGIYAVASFSGLVDVDAITLSLSQLAHTKIDKNTAMYGIIIATVSNSLTKLAIVFFLGGVRIGTLLSIFYLLTLASLFAGTVMMSVW
jgi:uncharacterized membrane protein (DUF4010 family)